jgi:hypothetical protein
MMERLGFSMDLEDFLEPEVAVTAVVAAAIFSPKARRAIRKGVVYATAGALIAGDAISSFAKNVGQGAQQMRTPAQEAQGSPQGESGG